MSHVLNPEKAGQWAYVALVGNGQSEYARLDLSTEADSPALMSSHVHHDAAAPLGHHGKRGIELGPAVTAAW
jgi:hypothetical protein